MIKLLSHSNEYTYEVGYGFFFFLGMLTYIFMRTPTPHRVESVNVC